MQIGVETSRAVDNKRIFVVDDDEITRAALQFMLHDENETHEVPSLGEAFAKGAERRPDLILLALGLLKEKGLGLLGELDEKMPKVRILLVADAGAHGILTKPLTVENVRRKVDILLGRGSAAFVPLQVLSSRPQ